MTTTTAPLPSTLGGLRSMATADARIQSGKYAQRLGDAMVAGDSDHEANATDGFHRWTGRNRRRLAACSLLEMADLAMAYRTAFFDLSPAAAGAGHDCGTEGTVKLIACRDCGAVLPLSYFAHEPARCWNWKCQSRALLVLDEGDTDACEERFRELVATLLPAANASTLAAVHGLQLLAVEAALAVLESRGVVQRLPHGAWVVVEGHSPWEAAE